MSAMNKVWHDADNDWLASGYSKIHYLRGRNLADFRDLLDRAELPFEGQALRAGIQHRECAV